MLSDVVADLGLCWNRIMGALCSKASGEGITCWRRQSSTSWDINSANAGLKHYKFPWMQCGIVRVREFVYSFCLVIIFAALAIPHLEGLTWGLCEQWWKKSLSVPPWAVAENRCSWTRHRRLPPRSLRHLPWLLRSCLPACRTGVIGPIE
jgi:hypothetical protein